MHKCNGEQDKIRLSVPSHSSPPSRSFLLSHCEYRLYPSDLSKRKILSRTLVRPSRSNRRVQLLRDSSRNSFSEFIFSIPSDGAGSCQRLGARIRVTTVYHTSYADLFTKRILVVLAHSTFRSAIREWSRLFRDDCHCKTQEKRAFRDEARRRSLPLRHNRPARFGF